MEQRPLRSNVLAERLADAIERSGLSKSEFATRAAVDRTTLSQLLSPTRTRLPRADTLRSIAVGHDLSLDWLLGLSDAGPVEAELMPYMSFEEAPAPAEVDEQLLEWFDETPDQKIRYVPATLPDLLKTNALNRFERAGAVGPDPARTIATTAANLTWARHPGTEMECCSSSQSIAAFARGDGTWHRLGAEARREQIDRMIELTDELYPSFRWFLFDGSRRYAAPVTVFGTRRAALYLGGLYLVLTSAEHVRTLSRHFDGIIRDATIQPNAIGDHLRRLRRQVS